MLDRGILILLVLAIITIVICLIITQNQSKSNNMKSNNSIGNNSTGNNIKLNSNTGNNSIQNGNKDNIIHKTTQNENDKRNDNKIGTDVALETFLLSVEPAHDSFVELPLYFANGYYKTRFKLTDGKQYVQSFQAIPDTGSYLLILSGSQCKECVHEDGVWDPSKGVQRTKEQLSITYGGGQQTSFYPWQAYFIDDQDHRIAEFGLVTSSHNHQQRPQNVMGLSPIKNNAGNKNPSFLDSLGVPRKVKFDYPQQRLIIGDDYRNAIIRKSITLFSNHSLNYPFAKVLDLKIPNHLNQKIPNLVQFAVFDTGTNYSVVPKNLYNSIVTINQTLPKQLIFYFESSNGPEKTNNRVEYKFDTSYLIPGDVPIPNTMIIGSKSFDTAPIEFDYDAKKINFY